MSCVSSEGPGDICEFTTSSTLSIVHTSKSHVTVTVTHITHTTPRAVHAPPRGGPVWLCGSAALLTLSPLSTAESHNDAMHFLVAFPCPPCHVLRRHGELELAGDA